MAKWVMMEIVYRGLTQGMAKSSLLTKDQDAAFTLLAKGYQQKRVAELIGVTRQTLNKWLKVPHLAEAYAEIERQVNIGHAIARSPEVKKGLNSSPDDPVDRSKDLINYLDMVMDAGNVYDQVAKLCLSHFIKGVKALDPLNMSDRSLIAIGRLSIDMRNESVLMYQEALGVQALAAELEKRKENV